MNPFLLILATAPADLPPGADDRAIVVTASREPVDRETSPESTSVLSDETVEAFRCRSRVIFCV
jgi:outer membrane receptor protein involved in Fe transport